MALLDRLVPASEYSLAESSALKEIFNNPAMKSALEKFCARRMWQAREDSFDAAERDLRKADKLRGEARVYQDFVNELHDKAKQL